MGKVDSHELRAELGAAEVEAALGRVGNLGDTSMEVAVEEIIGLESDQESSSEDNDCDSQGDGILQDPSQNIREDLKSVLSSIADFNGTFGWSKTHQSSPNPCLNIAGLGVIGLPLSQRDAQALIGVCRRAPSGEDELTVVDISVSNTWELDHSQILFENPKWENWLKTIVVPQVCTALGVCQGSTAIAEFYKLHLYGTGSHVLPRQDTENSPGMFGTIVIVLPSRFTGGSLHLSHSGQTKIIDLASYSLTTSSVLAWHSDVYHSINPILSGYRLALSYNLMLPPSSKEPKPILPKMGPVIDRLRHVLLSWRQCEHDVAKLVYILGHQYSQESLNGGAFTGSGSDANVFRLLRPIAEELGFQMYLANLELEVRGNPDVCALRHHLDRNEDDDEEDFPMSEVVDFDLTIEHTVDLDGIPVKIQGITIDRETEIVNGDLDDNKPEQSLYLGYFSNRGGLTFWYRRTVLIIWPRAGDFKIHINDITSISLPELASSTSTAPTPRETKLVEHLLTSCRHDPDDVTLTSKACEVLRVTAIRWKDPDMWLRALEIGKLNSGIRALTFAGFVEGIQAFGLRAMKTFLSNVYELEPSNTLRFGLLDCLITGARPDEREAVQAWCQDRWSWLLCNLRRPELEDVPLLTRTAKMTTSEVVHDSLIPQIINLQPDQAFWTPFAGGFMTEWLATSASSDSSIIAAKDVLFRMILAAVKSFKAFSVQDVDFFTDVAKICGACFVRDEVLPQIVVLAVGDQAFWTAFTGKLISEKDMIPDPDSFDEMFSDVVVATVDSFEVISSEDVDFLVRLAIIQGVGFMRDIALPHLAPIAAENNLWGTLLIKLYESCNSIPPDSDAVIAMVSQFVESSVTTNPFPVKKDPSSVLQPNVDAIIDLVHLCFSTNHMEAYPMLFRTMHTTFVADHAKQEYRSTAYYIPLATKLKALKEGDSTKARMIAKTVSELVLISVTSSPAFPVKKNSAGTEEADPQPILELLQLCLSLDNPRGCCIVFNKMESAFNRLTVRNKALKLYQYYIPLVSELEKRTVVQVNKDSIAPAYQVLANSFYELVLPAMGQLSFPAASQVIVSVLKWSGGPAVLKSQKFASWMETAKPDSVKEFVLVLVRHRLEIIAAGFDRAALDDMINRLAVCVIDKTIITPTIYYIPPRFPVCHPGLEFSVTIQLLQFCSEFPTRIPLSNRVLQRLLIPHKTIGVADWITKSLMVFVPIMNTHLLKQDIADVPYADFCSTVMRGFITEVLKSKPAWFDLPDQMKNFGCGCANCLSMRRFFEDASPYITFRETPSQRNHLEKELARVKVFGISWETYLLGSISQLKVTKPSKMMEAEKWREKSAQGLAFMNKLGDEKRQKKIFGNEYEAFVMRLKGEPLLAPPTPTVSHSLAATTPVSQQPESSNHVRKLAQNPGDLDLRSSQPPHKIQHVMFSKYSKQSLGDQIVPQATSSQNSLSSRAQKSSGGTRQTGPQTKSSDRPSKHSSSQHQSSPTTTNKRRRTISASHTASSPAPADNEIIILDSSSDDNQRPPPRPRKKRKNTGPYAAEDVIDLT